MRRWLTVALALGVAAGAKEVAHSAPARFSWQAVADVEASALKDNAPEVRYRAIAVLATLSPDTAGPLLLPLVVLDPTDLRTAQDAIAALGMLGYQPAVPALLHVLASPSPELRVAALRALAAMDAAEGLGDIIRSLGDPQPTVRATAAWTLGELGATKPPRIDIISPLVGRLQDKTVSVRLSALGALAKLSDPRASLAVAAAMSDDHIDVRRAALSAALAAGDSSLAASVVPLLRDPNTDIRQLAARALGVLGDRDSATALLTAYAAAGPERSEVLVALAHLARRGHQADAIAHVVANASALGDAGASVAIFILGAEFAPRACAILDGTERGDITLALAALAKAPQVSSRACVLRELGRKRSPVEPLFTALATIATPQSIADLAVYIGDVDPAIALLALRIAAPHTALDPRVIDVLTPLVNHPQTETAALAILGLGNTGDASALAPLQSVLAPTAADASGLVAGRGAKPNPITQWAAIDALGTLANPDALPLLLTRMRTAPALEALRIARAIAAIGDAKAAPELTAIATANRSQSGAALEALVLLAKRHGAGIMTVPLAQWRRWAAHADVATAHAAIAGLAILKSADARDALLAAARTSEATLAAQASCSLIAMPIAPDVRAWTELLAHPSDAVAACAAEGLGGYLQTATSAPDAPLLEALGKAATRGWATAITSTRALACAHLSGAKLSPSVTSRLQVVARTGSPLAQWNAAIALDAAATVKPRPPTDASLFVRIYEPEDDIAAVAQAGYVAWTTCRDAPLGWAGYTDSRGWLDRPGLATSELAAKFAEAQLIAAQR